MDLLSVCELLSESGLAHEDISLHLPHTAVAKIEGHLVGTAAIEPYGAAALLRSVCVQKQYRSLGVATRLCDLVSAYARNLGATHLTYSRRPHRNSLRLAVSAAAPEMSFRLRFVQRQSSFPCVRPAPFAWRCS